MISLVKRLCKGVYQHVYTLSRVSLSKDLDQTPLPKGVTRIKTTLPKGITLAFCPTGPGGGIDPTCPSGKGGSGGIKVNADNLSLMGKTPLTNASVEKVGSEGWLADTALQITDLTIEREQIDAEIKRIAAEAKASGVTTKGSGVTKLYARRAELGKAIKSLQAQTDGKTLTPSAKAEKAAIPKLKEPKAIAKVLDVQAPVIESGIVDSAIRPDLETSLKYVNEADHKSYCKSLRAWDLQAVVEYTGEDYAEINKELRKSKGKSELKGSTKALSKVIDNAPPLEHEIVVGRGFVSDRLSKLKVGDEFVDHGFMSTTLDSDVLGSFALNNPGVTISGSKANESNVLNIRVPPGTKGLYLNSIGVKGEHEFLLQHGTKLRIEGVSVKPSNLKGYMKDTNIRTVQAVVVQD